MGRKRAGNVPLPEGVEKVRSRGRTYYYWNPGRGTARQGERIPLPNADDFPARFFSEVERRRQASLVYPDRSVGDVVARYRASQEFLSLAEKTQRTYAVHLDRFVKPQAWGLFRAADLTPPGVVAARDAMIATPVMANQMLTVGSVVYDWAIPLGLVDANPFDKVKPLDVPDRGYIPWPGWVVDTVLAGAPEDLCRMVRLGRMTCQRESDLVRLGPINRERSGIWCRPKKTRQRRRAFFIPLLTADAFELDRWAATGIVFSNPRFKAPIAHHREDLYVYSPKGLPYSTDSLRARWGRWLATDVGKAVCTRWRAWLTECVARYEWEIDPEEERGPTIHGLRGSGILLRHAAGYDTGQIANDVGMSRPMVEHYMRFKDQMEVAAAGQLRLAVVGGGP